MAGEDLAIVHPLQTIWGRGYTLGLAQTHMYMGRRHGPHGANKLNS